ncbi:transcriptional repressor TraM [Rhizobium leguminosarum]|uniref:transcriptional repressor TraM n=1 Tax=Rhizobium leguminosarum TaxID=384 RepID=UPI001FEFDE65|nr:transcriptional repressor TraM [Rhizobium leguminosarum]
MIYRADARLLQASPEDHKSGKAGSGVQHLCYIEATIEMLRRWAVNTLVRILSYIPKVSVNRVWLLHEFCADYELGRLRSQGLSTGLTYFDTTSTAGWNPPMCTL